MFGIGVQELALIFVVALLIFGPKRLPELARTLGKGMAEFRRASADLRHSFSLDADSPPPRPPTPPPPRPLEPPQSDPREQRDADHHPDQAVGSPFASPGETSPADGEGGDTCSQATTSSPPEKPPEASGD